MAQNHEALAPQQDNSIDARRERARARAAAREASGVTDVSLNTFASGLMKEGKDFVKKMGKRNEAIAKLGGRRANVDQLRDIAALTELTDKGEKVVSQPEVDENQDWTPGKV